MTRRPINRSMEGTSQTITTIEDRMTTTLLAKIFVENGK